MASLEDALRGSLDLPFPAPTKQVAGIVNGVQTDVMVMTFSDKIMLTISQEGRLSHWV
jgi:proteasome assembly chaperone 3